ncbi:MAG: hypothetical protein KDC38_01900 [Planctomycetes bacterium]|nr:hypothetical protein [Planctomycetota bacterium]
MPRLVTLLLLAAAMAVPAVVQAQSVVYDNLDPSDFGDFYPALFQGKEFGDEITLAPGPRAITSFRFAPGSSQPISRFDLTLRFREVGSTEPGAEIWSGTYTALESYGGIFVMHDLDVPDVVVPDTFVFTVEVDYQPGFGDGSAYFNGFGGPVVGSSGAFVWVEDHPSFGPGWVAAASPPCADCVFNLACTFFADGSVPIDTFRRGDSNDDGMFDIGDPVFILGSLFVPGAASPSCEDAADANDDGVLDIADPVYQLAALFVPGSPALPATCGVDTTADSLDCAVSAGCP